jgi:uncharacterized protein YjcR
MNLPDYIKKYGDKSCASLFQVKVRTVASWRRRERFPRQKQAEKIIELTNGILSMDGIYGVAMGDS